MFCLVFRRVVAGERRRRSRETRSPHCASVLAAFHASRTCRRAHEAPAEFLEDRRLRRDVGLVALVALHVDPPDPVALRPLLVLPCSLLWLARSRRRSRRPPPWDRALDDRTADHQIVGAGGDRRAGVMMRFWSPAALPAGRMPGVTSTIPARRSARSDAASSAEQTSPSMPVSRACAARAAASSLTFMLVAGGGKIGIVVGGEHGHGENAQPRAAACLRPPPSWSADRRAR